MRRPDHTILTSIAIGVAMSLLFTALSFGRSDPVSVWSRFGLAFDMIPQSFMIGLMSALMPSLAARKRQMGLPATEATGYRTRSEVVIRSVAIAIVATLLGGGGAIALLALGGDASIPFAMVLPGKALFGAIEAAIVTPLALRAI